jgi:hypothetical protein
MLSGTGFIFKFFSNQKHSVPVIVTNRHILKDILSVTFYFNSGDAEIHPFPSEVFHYGLLIRHKLYQSINWFVTIRPYTKLDLNLIGCTTLDIMTSTCIKT